MPPKGVMSRKKKTPAAVAVAVKGYEKRKKPLKGGGISSLG
jgi:hypothetical protein